VPFAEARASIAAPIDAAWRAMLAFDEYAAWNPFIVRVQRSSRGPVRVGDELTLHVRWSSGRRVSSHERISRLEPPARDGEIQRATLEYEFRGPLAALGLVRGRRLQTLEQAPGGPTLYRTSERLHGLLAGLAPIRSVQDGFERHAAALAAWVEAAPRRTALMPRPTG
jgi:hypothetical protein